MHNRLHGRRGNGWWTAANPCLLFLALHNKMLVVVVVVTSSSFYVLQGRVESLLNPFPWWTLLCHLLATYPTRSCIYFFDYLIYISLYSIILQFDFSVRSTLDWTAPRTAASLLACTSFSLFSYFLLCSSFLHFSRHVLLVCLFGLYIESYLRGCYRRGRPQSDSPQ